MAIRVKTDVAEAVWGDALTFFGIPFEHGPEGTELLGGKGQALVTRAKAGLPVPPGFVIHTAKCLDYQRAPKTTENKLRTRIRYGLKRLEKHLRRPTLVSVRSGARVSMPGMMDTVLNVGLTVENLPFWEAKLGAVAALDCFRRLLTMFGVVVSGMSAETFENPLREVKATEGVTLDSELSEQGLRNLVAAYLKLYQLHTSESFPTSPKVQVMMAVLAVFRSWNNERAREYRRIHRIPSGWGTAATVQTMVFGNLNDESCSGVLFTRNPSNGKNMLYGEFLPRAQGEDVVAGTRTPLPLADMAQWNPMVLGEIVDLCATLESTSQDMQDVEFTVESGKLWLLQTRSGKRTPEAAIAIAVDMAEEGLISRADAFKRVSSDTFYAATRTVLDPSFKDESAATGTPACPGLVSGVAVFTKEVAQTFARDGKAPILIREETDPDDFAGMAAAVGVLTAVGGTTSHAAVVCRAMNKPCVVGVPGIEWEEDFVKLNGMPLAEGDPISFDGSTGRVWRCATLPVIEGKNTESMQKLVEWVVADSGEVVLSDRLMASKQWLSVVSLTDAGYAVNAEAVADLAKSAAGREVFVDAARFGAQEPDVDGILWGMFGEPRETRESAAEKALAAMSEAGVTGVVVALGHEPSTEAADLMRAAGFLLAAEAVTVADVLSSPTRPVFVSQEFRDTILGGQEAMETLFARLTEAGVAVRTLLTPKSVDEILALTLGGK